MKKVDIDTLALEAIGRAMEQRQLLIEKLCRGTFKNDSSGIGRAEHFNMLQEEIKRIDNFILSILNGGYFNSFDVDMTSLFQQQQKPSDSSEGNHEPEPSTGETTCAGNSEDEVIPRRLKAQDLPPNTKACRSCVGTRCETGGFGCSNAGLEGICSSTAVCFVYCHPCKGKGFVMLDTPEETP